MLPSEFDKTANSKVPLDNNYMHNCSLKYGRGLTK